MVVVAELTYFDLKPGQKLCVGDVIIVFDDYAVGRLTINPPKQKIIEFYPDGLDPIIPSALCAFRVKKLKK